MGVIFFFFFNYKEGQDFSPGFVSQLWISFTGHSFSILSQAFVKLEMMLPCSICPIFHRVPKDTILFPAQSWPVKYLSPFTTFSTQKILYVKPAFLWNIQVTLLPIGLTYSAKVLLYWVLKIPWASSWTENCLQFSPKPSDVHFKPTGNIVPKYEILHNRFWTDEVAFSSSFGASIFVL